MYVLFCDFLTIAALFKVDLFKVAAWNFLGSGLNFCGLSALPTYPSSINSLNPKFNARECVWEMVSF
jgi:hypothetical protein